MATMTMVGSVLHVGMAIVDKQTQGISLEKDPHWSERLSQDA
jgi:hypothetical protein